MKIYVLVRFFFDQESCEVNIIKCSHSRESLEKIRDQIAKNWNQAFNRYKEEIQELALKIKEVMDQDPYKASYNDFTFYIHKSARSLESLPYYLARRWNNIKDGYEISSNSKFDVSRYNHLQAVSYPKQSNEMVSLAYMAIHESELIE